MHNLTKKDEAARDAVENVQKDETLNSIRLSERNETLNAIEASATRALVNVTREEQQLLTTIGTANAYMDLADGTNQKVNTTATDAEKKLNRTETILNNLAAAGNASFAKIVTASANSVELQQLSPYFESIKTNMAKLFRKFLPFSLYFPLTSVLVSA